MGLLLHGSARTTHATRRALHRSQKTVSALAVQHGLNRKTAAKWRKRQTVEAAPMGPKQPRSTVLSPEEEATIVAFRRHTLLPLDDCLYALQPTMPHLTRSSLHRCLQRHGISRLPEVEEEYVFEGTKYDAEYLASSKESDLRETATSGRRRTHRPSASSARRPTSPNRTGTARNSPSPRNLTPSRRQRRRPLRAGPMPSLAPAVGATATPSSPTTGSSPSRWSRRA